MSEVTNNKYLDFEGLKKYDVLIKNFIATGNTALADAIAALDKKIGSLDIEGSEDESLMEIVEGIYASIAEIIEKQGSLEAKDDDLAIQIKKISEDLEYITGGSSDNEATLGEINATLVNVQGELDEIKDFIEILTGSEDEISIKKIAESAAAEAVAAIVDGAPAAFDTLKEVAEWIASDTQGSTALQITVSGHTESINTINTDLDALENKVDQDINNLTIHINDAANALNEVDDRLNALETPISTVEIEELFRTNTEDSDSEA